MSKHHLGDDTASAVKNSLHTPSAHSSAAAAAATLQYPVRRMRNTAVLVKWIEEHQSNPYPTKAEKQYLAYYSGMNLTQLSTWFANARRRIKKIGMKTWLEGRSTFTVDFFPAASPALTPSRADYLTNGSSYTTGTNPYASMQYSSLSGYQPQHLGPAAAPRLHSNYTTDLTINPSSSTSAAVNYGGLYTPTSRTSLTQPLIGVSAFANWSPTAPPLVSTSTPSGGSLSAAGLQARPSSNTGPTLHSPLTAQVYTGDSSSTLRNSGTLDMSEYSLSQHSPDQMLPECASSEPMLQGSSPKSSHYSAGQE